MRLYHSDQLAPQQSRDLCVRAWTRDGALAAAVEALCDDVQSRGDEAVREYSARFDATVPEDFRVSSEELENAQDQISPELREALEQAARNIRTFHSVQMRKEERVETQRGVFCWREFRAIESVGLYAPAGSAPLPSTVLMLGIPALIAGCRRIILCSPPKGQQGIDPTVLAAASIVGLKEIYIVGGAQAIAAMAYGTQSIPKVDKIFGPGNQYVTEAKRIVSSDPAGAAIDMLAGPSELLLIADDSADPRIVAADLLSQAEHDPKSQVVLVTPSEDLARTTLAELALQLQLLPRNTIAAAALENSYALVVPSLDEAVAFSNQYAPEHLILNVAGADAFANKVEHAGSVFLGPNAPVTAGDYASGTNHTLPTGATARSYSGVTVESFQKSMTFQSLTGEGLRELTPTLVTLAEAEGLEAHARAVRVRQ